MPLRTPARPHNVLYSSSYIQRECMYFLTLNLKLHILYPLALCTLMPEGPTDNVTGVLIDLTFVHSKPHLDAVHSINVFSLSHICIRWLLLFLPFCLLIGISSILLHASWLDRLIVCSIIVQLHCISVLLPCQVYICTSWVVVFLPCQLETCIYWILVHTP